MDLLSPTSKGAKSKGVKTKAVKSKAVTPESLESVALSVSSDDSSPFVNISSRSVSAKSRRTPLSIPTPRSGSICNQYTKEECNPPACEYVEGEKRQFCRMSRKYKSTASGNLTRRINREEATEKIKKFLKTTDPVIRAICGDSSQCVSFGKMTTEITKLFKGFTGFEYAVSPIKKIGAVSNNGFVKQIRYNRKGYNAHAILKSAIKPDSDNLVYEYIVGNKFINRILKKFPCFVETYGLFYYKTIGDWSNMSLKYPQDKSVLKGLELQKSFDYNKACKYSKYASILIQHIDDAESIGDSISQVSYNNFTKYELLYVLFIVYQALASISKKFTHYDLHQDNVILYQPEQGKYIHYHYHLSNGTDIHFKCSVIPKIIDYGRSFFDNDNMSSKNVSVALCRARDCVKCGEKTGFSWLDRIPYLTISSQKKNESHDLRLLVSVKKILDDVQSMRVALPREKGFLELNTMLTKIVYGEGIDDVAEKSYGTTENLLKHADGSKITNVKNAYEYLKNIVLKSEVSNENEARFLNPANKLGDFHIYEDGRDMQYIPL